MFTPGYFYNRHIRRAVTVFGSLFNDLTVVKRDSNGGVISSIKVPLSYGPTQKFLSRIRDESNLSDPKLAIRLPRMSFEMTGITLDSTLKSSRANKKVYLTENSLGDLRPLIVNDPVPYRIGFSLSIYGKNQDDVLQILEQIIPFFQPDYTVTVREIDGSGSRDMPFVLQGVNPSDDYEGEFVTRRAIIYTLEFETRVAFYGPLDTSATLIKSTKTIISDINMSSSGDPYTVHILTVNPFTAGPDDDYVVESTFDDRSPARVSVGVLGVIFNVGETVVGQVSGTVGRVISSDVQYTLIDAPDGMYFQGEQLIGESSGETGIIVTIDNIWNTAL